MDSNKIMVIAFPDSGADTARKMQLITAFLAGEAEIILDEPDEDISDIDPVNICFRYTSERSTLMNTNENTTFQIAAEAECPDFMKQIGKTTYKVKVHFSTTSKETMSDKIKRLLCYEVEQM